MSLSFAIALNVNVLIFHFKFEDNHLNPMVSQYSSYGLLILRFTLTRVPLGTIFYCSVSAGFHCLVTAIFCCIVSAIKNLMNFIAILISSTSLGIAVFHPV